MSWFFEAEADSRSDEEIVGLLTADLRLTMAYLRVHPKVYWIWTHRKWCLENVPLGPEGSEGWRNEFWKNEIMLVEKLLEADPRNCEYQLCALQMSCLTNFSPCMELSSIHQRIAPFILHAGTHTRR